MVNRHKWKYTDNCNFPRKCVKCGVKETIKKRPSKKGPGKVDQVFHQFSKQAMVEGNAPTCTGT
jgi:hypothetical protein